MRIIVASVSVPSFGQTLTPSPSRSTSGFAERDGLFRKGLRDAIGRLFARFGGLEIG